ncbi:Predicted nucleotide-binding protein, sugar kinase/HSP70/actin superfamily [Desulfonatronum thiosulfatophilum]|uniref:Predicted nucleotide-binding protein, sugar kinase/HSP70/actin superfamily n=1 Tax=Desulfonatronum thiosulfatophilum TaxID=617002 RepID=A0A1G6BBX6_9BACT|nr:CoA activase [Desulfonatronum thiosulfatophilum]SDB18124.1 Predicted nucleotide-binding protein, sugar kinase/HSP70/actin superfamily [Desulfonatronum thiosulfatophilum]
MEMSPHKPKSSASFADRMVNKVGQFDVAGRTLLIPDMSPTGSRLLAASFRAFGVPSVVMPTYTHLHLGKEFTSGKECFPCQVTLGDILGFLEEEKKRQGDSFNVSDYVYFMPEADGPCRFGMYNKMHRLVLDRFPDFKDIPILYMSTSDGYASTGILPGEKSKYFRRLAYVTMIVADVLDRITWRVRPYEREPGQTDAYMATALQEMMELVEKRGEARDFDAIYALLGRIAAHAKTIIDPAKPRKPRIGIIGEIYLRTHPESNQNIIAELERFDAEVVDASLGEWVNYVAFEQYREICKDWKQAWQRKDMSTLADATRKWAESRIEMAWQGWRQNQVYEQALKHLDIQADHPIPDVEKKLDNDRLFTFDIGTEAALSIGGALGFVHDNFDGVVNVYPFTCMPSTIASAVLKPLLLKQNVPYIDASYDGAIQPNREVALRTFMYQAAQHKAARDEA